MTLAEKNSLEEPDRSTFEHVCATCALTNKVFKRALQPDGIEQAFEVLWFL